MVGFFKRAADKISPGKAETSSSLPESRVSTIGDSTHTAKSGSYTPGKAASTPYPSTTEPPRPMHNSGIAVVSDNKHPVPPTRTTTGNSIEALDRFEEAGAGVTPDFARRHNKEPHRSTPGHNMNAFDYPAYPSSISGEGEHIVDPKALEIEQRDKSVRGYDSARIPDYVDEATDLDPRGKGLDGRPGGRGTKHSAFGLGGAGMGPEKVPEPTGPASQGHLRKEIPIRGGREETVPSQTYYESREGAETYRPVRNQSFEEQTTYPTSTIDRGQAIQGEPKRIILNHGAEAQTAYSGAIIRTRMSSVGGPPIATSVTVPTQAWEPVTRLVATTIAAPLLGFMTRKRSDMSTTLPMRGETLATKTALPM
ncbi:hypothetical protein BJ508DRAFT_412122 [Ascobolus immersus RN42]|uniref:Uncharacterized protein n=1 Tax=Ascobolus immersus RN42 TaxID=1160509 RepID=A0A3N4IIT5_ASCIM|nr:hypothetical protein BJ508DRAFT_412122 [Ascobolus immersus RN42]